MQPIKKIYILSLVALGVLLVLTFFQPLATGKQYSTVQKEQIINTGDGWLIQFNLVNRQGSDCSFTIYEAVDTEDSCQESVLIPPGGVYVYTHHILSENVSQETVYFTIYREQEEEPVEKLTYYLK